MPKFKHKEGGKMFNDEILEKIFADEEVQKVPIGYQSTMVSVIERVLEEMGVKTDATISKS